MPFVCASVTESSLTVLLTCAIDLSWCRSENHCYIVGLQASGAVIKDMLPLCCVVDLQSPKGADRSWCIEGHFRKNDCLWDFPDDAVSCGQVGQAQALRLEPGSPWGLDFPLHSLNQGVELQRGVRTCFLQGTGLSCWSHKLSFYLALHPPCFLLRSPWSCLRECRHDLGSPWEMPALFPLLSAWGWGFYCIAWIWLKGLAPSVGRYFLQLCDFSFS